jgi:hypothetical protein
MPLFFLSFSVPPLQSVFQGVLQGLEWVQNGRKTDRKRNPKKGETTTKKTASIQCLRANPDSNREDFELKKRAKLY